MKLPWSKIANALGYQAVWFVTLFSASAGHFWFGFFSSLVFSALMLVFGGNAKQDCRIVVIGLILGISIDTVFAASGWIMRKLGHRSRLRRSGSSRSGCHFLLP